MKRKEKKKKKKEIKTVELTRFMFGPSGKRN